MRAPGTNDQMTLSSASLSPMKTALFGALWTEIWANGTLLSFGGAFCWGILGGHFAFEEGKSKDRVATCTFLIINLPEKPLGQMNGQMDSLHCKMGRGQSSSDSSSSSSQSADVTL